MLSADRVTGEGDPPVASQQSFLARRGRFGVTLVGLAVGALVAVGCFAWNATSTEPAQTRSLLLFGALGAVSWVSALAVLVVARRRRWAGRAVYGLTVIALTATWAPFWT